MYHVCECAMYHVCGCAMYHVCGCAMYYFTKTCMSVGFLVKACLSFVYSLSPNTLRGVPMKRLVCVWLYNRMNHRVVALYYKLMQKIVMFMIGKG